MRRTPAQREKLDLERTEEVEAALFEKAKEGHVIACLVWLYNRNPQRWKDLRRPDSITSISARKPQEGTQLDL